VGRTTIPLPLNFCGPNLFGCGPNLEDPEKGLLGGSLTSVDETTASLDSGTLFDFVMEVLYNISHNEL